MTLGRRIKAIITKDKGLKLVWVADKLGINEKTFIGRLNLDRLSGEDLLRTAAVCNIDLNELRDEYKNVTE